MKIISNNLIAQDIQRIGSIRNNNINKDYANAKTSFDEILKDTIDGNSKLQFSKHASMRLSARDIKISDAQMKRVEDGVLKAQIKGINESLVIVDDIALVVNIKNKIVVTAINKGQEGQNDSGGEIFTNIDGAVIV